jgi:hypothetical protein
MSVDNREVLHCIMQRGMITARQRRRSTAYIMWFLMIKVGMSVVAKLGGGPQEICRDKIGDGRAARPDHVHHVHHANLIRLILLIISYEGRDCSQSIILSRDC